VKEEGRRKKEEWGDGRWGAPAPALDLNLALDLDLPRTFVRGEGGFFWHG
jgi:hypothetical protein